MDRSPFTCAIDEGCIFRGNGETLRGVGEMFVELFLFRKPGVVVFTSRCPCVSSSHAFTKAIDKHVSNTNYVNALMLGYVCIIPKEEEREEMKRVERSV
jgi:hypothetical protein